ncbi:DMT family transporter [Ideonella sp. 4Y16]|uniref:DMT family transporter n=1 Tax=Ideonella alba TaxID=2824118 RepID=A0A941BG79_9BURK|nr:DMT family transporter [Ideonella alba]MBQ0930228.1 DMT family transporter [Ideonella alba]MBQ0943297.1 DMT family transporter [Ideonella alba]
MNSANKGLMIGALGVLIFAMTLPMTRLAVGPLEAPQLPPAFVTAGRAAGAGLLSVVYLWAVGAARPRGAQWGLLGVSALGTVLGFPLGLALALRQVPSMHAAVITGLLPLATAAIAALALRQRASLGFWVCAVLGCALVLAFAAFEGGGALVAADGWLLMAMLCASGGYVAGARLTAQMPAEQVISWVLVMSLPLTLPAAAWSAPASFASVQAASWGAFAYVTLFSMWLGFFAWYRGLALGGALRVSQVQLIQPFLSLLLAVPVLGEALKPSTLGFSVAVIAVVFVGKRMPVGR